MSFRCWRPSRPGGHPRLPQAAAAAGEGRGSRLSGVVPHLAQAPRGGTGALGSVPPFRG